MKKKIALALVSVSMPLALAQPAHAGPEWVPVPATHVYAPQGFDTNDNTEVVVSGYLPNLCYKAAQTSTKVKGKEIQVEVKALKWGSGSGTMCAQMAVPFLETAQVGVLDKGKYQVSVNAGRPSEKKGEIQIVESTSNAIDDFVYANVDTVERVPGTRRVILKGENPSDCYVLDRVQFVSNGKDAYSVLPIMRQVLPTCAQVKSPFSIEAEVPTDITAEQVLLHVRILDGKSTNQLFSNVE